MTDEMDSHIDIAETTLQAISHKLHDTKRILHKIAEREYDDGNLLEDSENGRGKETWIQNRINYYLSKEFMNE